MANTGTTKLKKIVSRALEIREKAGFTTETISRKRYNMAYIPDAVKQAAKELKTGETKPAKRVKRTVKTVAFKPRKPRKYDYMIVEETYKGEVYKNYIKYIDATHVAISRTLNKAKSYSGMAVYHIGQLRDEPYYKNMMLWMVTERNMNEIYVYRVKEGTKRKRILNKSAILHNKKVRKAVNSKGGAKVVDKTVKVSSKQAIEDLKHLYRDLTPMEANILYSNFKDNDIVDFDFEGLKAKIFEKLFDKLYIDYDVHKSTYNLTDFGRKFIKAVKGRIETLKGLKYGYNLF